MRLTLRMIHLGDRASPAAPLAIHDDTILVRGLEEASTACLARIRESGIPRDRWVGGIVTMDGGREKGQVSYNGIVFQAWPAAPDTFYEGYAPPGIESKVSVKPLSDESIALDIPGMGPASLSLDTTGDEVNRVTFSSEPGFEVGGVAAEYCVMQFSIASEGVLAVTDTGYAKLLGEEERDAPEGLVEDIRQGLTDWLGDPANAEGLRAMVERHAEIGIALPREKLSNSDLSFEFARREMLARVLEVIAFREGFDGIVPRGPNPA